MTFAPKQIQGFKGSARKLNGKGNVSYSLWVDSTGHLYVQICGNDTPTESPGTYSDYIFSMAELVAYRSATNKKPYGWDPNAKIPKESSNTNDPGFLEAVLKDLLP
jgi:hypothetical protein